MSARTERARPGAIRGKLPDGVTESQTESRSCATSAPRHADSAHKLATNELLFGAKLLRFFLNKASIHSLYIQ
ncbi:unnamed protein product [Nippostrongylus brasiliensis]|uniref:Uncharacterized protein n=1 Tax=Nippostrongylus brasiliensis TaxID=27835 RepID=A0A0N4YAF4_NIPBR|nr:unnamed protein product [Nippostrongylus brasiliensis]